MRYAPSPYEQVWFDGPAAGRICEKTSWQVEGSLAWLSYAKATRSGSARRPPTPEQQRVLSRFDSADGTTEYIEPLTGMARHPFTPIWGCARRARAGGGNLTLRARILKVLPSGVLDTSYLLPQNSCGRQSRRSNYFFDLGTSIPGPWSSDHGGGHAPKGSKADRVLQSSKSSRRKANISSSVVQVEDGQAVSKADYVKAFQRNAGDKGRELDLEGIELSSLGFFCRLYEANCIQFDRIYAWEAAQYDGKDWWRHVPLEIRAKLTFFNLPVESVRGSLDSGARSGRASPADPLAMIHQVAKPEDFVAMKVDIDGGPELELVTRVADNEGGVADLIDELYFEYHFRFDGLNFGWLTHKGGRNYQKWNHTVDDALALMRRLRRRGIRAHFWV